MSMERPELSVQVRSERKKGAARKIRRSGLIPAVLYGPSVGNVLLAIDPHALLKAMDTEAGTNTLIKLRVEGGGDLTDKVVMLRDLQVDPLNRTPLHADLYEITMDETVMVEVPVRLLGKAVGIDEGGILDQGIRELRVECLPGSIPEVLELDVTALGMGQSIHVSEIVLPEGVKVVGELTTAVASISAPLAEEEVAAPAEGEEPVEGEAAAPAEGEEAAPPAEGETPDKPKEE
jgi:large subunit ribosomal protein L25